MFKPSQIRVPVVMYQFKACSADGLFSGDKLEFCPHVIWYLGLAGKQDMHPLSARRKTDMLFL